MHACNTSTLKLTDSFITIGISYKALRVRGYVPTFDASRVFTVTDRDGLDEKEVTTEVS